MCMCACANFVQSGMYTRVHTCRPLGRQGRGPCLHLVLCGPMRGVKPNFGLRSLLAGCCSSLRKIKFPICKKNKIPAVQNRVEISSRTDESELLEGFVWAGERIEREPPGLLLLLLLLLWVFLWNLFVCFCFCGHCCFERRGAAAAAAADIQRFLQLYAVLLEGFKFRLPLWIPTPLQVSTLYTSMMQFNISLLFCVLISVCCCCCCCCCCYLSWFLLL
jgi:hypothetical protein